ncbi:hypothetical protein L6R50_27870 [Myxococcota bacterium]|nr:hypothetical protein [Myxococcota bacterium]
MIIEQTHTVGHEYVSEPSGEEILYPVRLIGPIGHKIRNGRVFCVIHSKSAQCKVNVYIRHAPAQTFREFATHSTPIAEASFNTTAQLLTGHTDVDTNGPIGPYIEVVLGIVGNGAVGAARCELWFEAKPIG